MIKILICVVVATIAVIGAFLILDPSIGIASTNNTVLVDDSNTCVITVEGAVYKEGSYTMDEGCTMLDLIDKAGGVNSQADSRAYYEDAILEGGMTYYIATKYDAADICNYTELTKANINLDSAQTIQSITNVKQSVAESIVTYRNENGLFSTVEQLMEVYGIGSATYKSMRNYVILHA